MSKRVVIIGGGIIGLCTAYYSARRGHTVTIVDRGNEKDEGCSFGNAGMVVPSHFVPLAAPGMVALGLKWMWNPESPFYIKPRLDWDLLNWAWKFYSAANAAHVSRSAPLLRDLQFVSRACFEELADATGNAFGLVKEGLLMLCKTDHTLDEEAKAAETARALGVPAEVLDEKQTAALDPNVKMDVAGAVYFPTDCHLNPASLMAVLRRELDKMGVRFVWNAPFKSWTEHSRRITSLSTAGGLFEADEFVVAGGSWSPEIVRSLGLRIPMQAGKGYSITLPNPRELPRICAILMEARIAATPMGGQLRFGGTMEIAGLNEENNPARIRGIIKAIPKYYPAFTPADFKDIPVWSGLRPCSPDGLPYVGRTQKYHNLLIATGHAMMGLSLGPITGKLMAGLLSGEQPSIPIAALNPDRYC